VRWRRTVALAGLGLALAGCGAGAPTDIQAEQRFLNSVYTQAPDISSYRTSSQLVSLGQAICQDLEAGASVQEVGDRVPLVEGNVALPPSDLGVVISAAAALLCPKYQQRLGQ
jgi:Protein of unknown function (DUF732)